MGYKQLSASFNYALAIVLGSGGFYFGYYIACWNPFSDPILQGVYGYNKDTDKAKLDFLNGLVNMLFAVGAMFGVLGTGALADTFGRRPILYIGEIIALICMLPYAVVNINLLMIARAISGLVAGINSSILAIMLAEMLPNELCGFGNAISYVSLTLAILLSYLTQNIFSYDTLKNNWRWFLLWPAVISVLRLICFPIFIRTDTPKYLYNSESDPNAGELKVKLALSKIYEGSEVDTIARESIKAYEFEKESKLTLGNLFSKKYKKRLFSGCLVAIAQQISGINFLIFYSNNLFEKMGANTKIMTLVVGLNNFVGSLLVIYLIGNMGRKFNLVFGSLCQGIGMFILYLGYKLDVFWILVVAVCFYMITFAIGLGATQPAYTGEILPPLGVGVSFSVQWILTALIGQFLPNLISIFGPDVLILFFGFACVAFFFLLDFFTVETKGKKEQQIIDEFENGKYKFLNFKQGDHQTPNPIGDKTKNSETPYRSLGEAPL